ncbi:MAG: hypothetical protein OZ917_03785 [Candidatus Brocadiaceae bacterium]|nr:hypothetical protein [Candidatus Brocadiaceae bacterium]
MKHIVLSFLFLIFIHSLTAAELLKNGDFESSDITGWRFWETYPWDGDGAPVELPVHLSIVISGNTGNIGTPLPPAASGFFALVQQVSSGGTARGGLCQEVKVVANTPYILTGCLAFYGDDIGDVTIIGILDGLWNPALAYTALSKYSIGGNTVSPWVEFTLTIIPSRDVITIFTETRQDWMYGSVAGWYDNLSLKPASESTRLVIPPNPKKNTIEKRAQD